jgi:hypothetical protein
MPETFASNSDLIAPDVEKVDLALVSSVGAIFAPGAAPAAWRSRYNTATIPRNSKQQQRLA